MLICVTGGNGYVGSVLVPILLADGHKVEVIDRYNPPSISGEFDYQQVDIYNDRVRYYVQQADAIIHLAAIVGYPACAKEPDLAWNVNFYATDYINQIRSRDQLVVFASSGTVYGPVIDGVCEETLPPNPQTVYAATKAMSEEQLLNKGNAIVLRFSTGFGVSPKMRFDVIPNNFTRLAIQGKLEVYQPDALRSFVHVRDMAMSFKFAIDNCSIMKDEIYNIGNESLNITKRSLAYMIQHKTGCKLSFVDGEIDPEERDYYVSFDKIRSLGYNADISIEQGVDELIEWFRNAKNLIY